MGDGSAERPDWSEGQRRFHLYAWAPSEERRARLRTGRLTDAELERPWRRRAVVHAVMRRWDQADFTPAAGPRLSFSQRLGLPGSLANAVRLEAAWAPTFIGSRGLLHEAEASLRVDLLVGAGAQPRVRLSPRAWVRWEGTLPGRPLGRTEQRLELAVELM